MKDNKQLLGGIPIMGMALSLVLAACATTGVGGGTALAKKLAADINALETGRARAKVDGDTVRITGEVYLKTGLTVPAGVTLDLTAAKAKFELQNGAILTVDGAVNASGHGDQGGGWVEGSLRLGEGSMVINGSGTISLKSRGCLLNVWEKCRLTLEGVTLVGIADNDRPLVEVSTGGDLVLKSGKITGNTRIGEDAGGGGVGVWEGGTFTMEGGEISGNSVNGRINANGGGVMAVGENAVFTMKGGKISGNSLNSVEDASGGGGVFIGKGTFTLEGGEISGNSATGTRMAIGGGIRVAEGGTFTMKGGKISGNSASGGAGADGGGVSVQHTAARKGVSVFIMEGGEIAGNSAAGGWAQGGGIRGSGDFIMRGGTIYGSDAGANANVVRDGKGAQVTGRGAAIMADGEGFSAKWGTGGTYTKGGVPQRGDSDIATTDATLIAIPAP